MNADGSRNVAVDLSVGGTLPAVEGITAGSLVGAVVLLIIGTAAIVAAIVTRRDARTGKRSSPRVGSAPVDERPGRIRIDRRIRIARGDLCVICRGLVRIGIRIDVGSVDDLVLRAVRAVEPQETAAGRASKSDPA